MDIAEVLGGIFLLAFGVLVAIPLPLDGWYYGPTPEAFVIGLIGGIFFIVLGSYLIIAGFRSEKKSQMREVVGTISLILSFSILFVGLVIESEFWQRVFLILGVGFLAAGVAAFLTSARKVAKKTTSKS